MERFLVSSSVLHSVGYDPLTWVMELAFHSGGVYQYYGISTEVFDTFISSPSLGSYFCAHIKGAFDWEKQNSP